MLDNWIGEPGKSYLQVVIDALEKEECFATFRQNEQYCQILEHVEEKQGWEYLRLIENGTIKQICLNSEEADEIGSPKVFSYLGRMLSPTTLRYGKVLDAVQKRWNFYSIESIVEIGVGYGGQARLISEFAAATRSKLKTYALLDLEPVQALAKKYLNLACQPCCDIIASVLPLTNDFDLAISCYAFSEFNRRLQEEYLQVLLKAKYGYLVMNTGLRNEPDRYSANELLTILPNAKIEEEQPKTGPNNYVLTFER